MWTSWAWGRVAGEPGMLMLRSGDSTVMVYESDYAGTNKANAATWSVTGDIEELVRTLRARGVPFLHYDDMPETTRQGDIHVSGDHKVAWCHDPDGNILCLATARFSRFFKLQEIPMSRYVDGFVVPVPQDKLDAYRRMARKAGKIWKEHGALEYVECVADDVKPGKVTSFPQAVKLKADETVVFSWIVYKSRSHRDSVNAKVMSDPRLASMMDPKAMPFDSKRMFWGGFKTLLEL